MKKEYQKPDLKMISLLIPEKIATDLLSDDADLGDAETGMESSIW